MRVTAGFKRRGINTATALAVAGMVLAAPSWAQGPGPGQPGAPIEGGVDALDLPKDIQMFGERDPSIRKATAIVNGTVITETDIDQRLALVVVANGGKLAEDERDRLRLQVLRNLIDETLQIQEAKAEDLKIDPSEVDQTFNRLASQFKRSPKEFSDYLTSVGSSAASLKRQIEGETAWRRVLGRKVEPFVNVGDDEVHAIMARLNASKGAEEYHIGEIYLSFAPATQAQVLDNAQRIVEQVRKGGSFVAYARQYSEASTKAIGGDLGWVRLEQLPEELGATARSMASGQLSDPIPLSGGYSIIAMLDKRQVLTADPRDSVLSLKQVSISFPKGTTQEQATGKVEAFAAMAKEIKGCGNVAEVAAKIGADVVTSDGIAVRDLPGPLQDIMLKLSIGESSPPFGTVEDGVRSLVLCGRDDPPAAGGPSFDQIYSQLEEERVNRRAQRYLRDLRRDAVIDYR